MAILIFLFGSKALQNAVAEGETRTISFHHVHTGEDLTITYKVNGQYVESALDKINWELRDWRRGEQIRMDPHLIDLAWEVQRETGSQQPIYVVCGYRSPATNSMLRRRSRGVARFSQHMLGHAMDFYIPGVPLEQLRVMGLRLQRGGVGFYPTSGSPFVHMDTGGVRMWPRMSRNELLRVFPDGRTAYLPSDGKPLKGYELALADLRRHGKNPSSTWSEDAEDAGLNGSELLAANSHRHDPFAPGKPERQEEPATTVVASAGPTVPLVATPAAQAQPTNALLAALEREARHKREAARVVAATQPVQPSTQGLGQIGNLIASAAFQPAMFQTASFESHPAPPPAARPVRPSSSPDAHLTPNQIIAARGSWEGAPQTGQVSQPAKGVPPGTAAAHREAANVAPAATGTVMPWPTAQDHVPPELALSYAAQPDPAIARTPVAAVTQAPTAGNVQRPPLPPATTVTAKTYIEPTAPKIALPAPRLASATITGRHIDNPWLTAMVISPSIRRYLTTLTLGVQDFRKLAPLVHKPASSVVMTFAADPNPGLTHDRFSGTAVMFLSTVTYPTHTASLH